MSLTEFDSNTSLKYILLHTTSNVSHPNSFMVLSRSANTEGLATSELAHTCIPSIMFLGLEEHCRTAALSQIYDTPLKGGWSREMRVF